MENKTLIPHWELITPTLGVIRYIWLSITPSVGTCRICGMGLKVLCGMGLKILSVTLYFYLHNSQCGRPYIYTKGVSILCSTAAPTR